MRDYTESLGTRQQSLLKGVHALSSNLNDDCCNSCNKGKHESLPNESQWLMIYPHGGYTIKIIDDFRFMLYPDFPLSQQSEFYI